MFKSIFSKFYYSQKEPASSDQTRTLVFASRNTPDKQIITATAREKLLRSLNPNKSETENGSTSLSKREKLKKIIGDLINKIYTKIYTLVGELIEWSHYQSGKAAEIIRNNLNSENPDHKLLEEINRHRRNFIATALAQARLGLSQPANFLETYRPYFNITEIPDQAAQRIKEIIKNAIRDCISTNQEANDNLINTITNQIMEDLKQLMTTDAEKDNEQVRQIQQILQDSDLISNLEQVVREILSDLRKIDPEEARKSEQVDHQAGLNNLDTIIDQLAIVLVTQPQYSAKIQADQRNLLQRLLDENLRLPIPMSWIASSILAILLATLLKSSNNELVNNEPIRMAISGSLGATIGFIDGWQLAKRQLKIAAEAQAANNPEQPLTNKQEFYKMISAKDLFENIQNALKNSGSAQPELIQKLLRQIHLIRILWNKYQYPILKNDLEGEDLEAIQNLAGQYGITLESNESPLVFYRNLLLLVEVLGIELIQKTNQALQSENGLSLNPETFWHQTGLNGLQKAVDQKVAEINQAVGWLSNRGFYLSKALKNAIICGVVNILLSEMVRSALSPISK